MKPIQTKIIIASVVGLIALSVFLLFPKPPIKVGLLSVLTGRNSQLGVFSREGVLLLVDKINAQGGINGRKIKMYIEDNRGDPIVNNAAIKKLLAKDVKLIIGPLTSNMAESTIETIKGKNAIVISPTISLDKVKDIDDNFLRTNNNASREGSDVATYMFKNGMFRASVVIDMPNKAYTMPVYQAFKNKFEKAGGSIQFFGQINKTTKTDFQNLAKKISQEMSDVLLIVTSGIDAASIAQQIRILNPEIQIMGGMWSKTKDVIAHGGKAVEGAVFVGKYETPKAAEKKVVFEKEYEALYHAKPSFISALAYEATSVLITALIATNDDNPLVIKNKIIEIRIFDGLEEEIIINKYGDTIRQNSLFVVKDGKFELITDQ